MSPPFSHANCPKCGCWIPGFRNSDGTVTYRCTSPNDYSIGGERWLDKHNIRSSYVGPTVFYEWTDKDAAYLELKQQIDSLKSRNAALEKVVLAARAVPRGRLQILDAAIATLDDTKRQVEKVCECGNTAEHLHGNEPCCGQHPDCNV